MLPFYLFLVAYLAISIYFFVFLQIRLKTVSLDKNIKTKIKTTNDFIARFLINTVLIIVAVALCYLVLSVFVDKMNILLFNEPKQLLKEFLDVLAVKSSEIETLTEGKKMFVEIINEWIFIVPVLLYFTYKYFMDIPSKRKLIKKKDSSLGTHGTSDWEEKKEIFEVLGKTDEGIILGELDKRKLVHPMDSGLNQIITTIGGSGSGKTAGYVITNILNIIDNIKSSIVTTDPKGELYNKTSQYARDNGYEVLVFNLLEPKKSMRKNPISHVTNALEAFTVAEMIVQSGGGTGNGDAMWSNAEMTFLAALILFVRETQPPEKLNLQNVFELGTTYAKQPEYLDILFDSLPNNSEAKRLYNVFAVAEGKTRSGILIGFGTRLKLWTSNDIRELTSENDFDFKILGEKPCILYILTSDSEKTFDLIPSLLINQMFNILYREANNNESEKLNVPVRVLGDEMANIARIEDLERKVSTMRSRGISIIPIFQSMTQFFNRYPEGRAQEILGSSDTLVYLGSNDKETNQYFSDMLGKTTYITNSINESENSTSESEGQNLNAVGKSLLEAAEMTKTLKTKVIIVQRGMNPILADKHFYYKQPQWSNLKQTHYKEIESYIYNPNTEIDFEPINQYITDNYAAYIERKEQGDLMGKTKHQENKPSFYQTNAVDDLDYEALTGKKN